MKEVVVHGVGDIRYEEVPDPQIENPKDVIVRGDPLDHRRLPVDRPVLPDRKGDK